MSRYIKTNTALLLFPADSGDLTKRSLALPGTYRLERVSNPLKKGGTPWLKIAGQQWGNAEPCWESVNTGLADFHPRSQAPALVAAVLCIILGLILFKPAITAKASQDVVPALNMELTELRNQLDNLTNHYSQMLSPQVQAQYQKRCEDAIYTRELFPLYSALQHSQQQRILAKKPDLQGYVAVVNGIDEELFHVWHDGSAPNRPVRIAEIQKKKARLLSSDLMRKQAQSYAAILTAGFNSTNIVDIADFNERLEQEVVDAQSALKEVARQNRDCATQALALLCRINGLADELDSRTQSKKPRKFFQTAGSP